MLTLVSIHLHLAVVLPAGTTLPPTVEPGIWKVSKRTGPKNTFFLPDQNQEELCIHVGLGVNVGLCVHSLYCNNSQELLSLYCVSVL